MGNYYSKTQRLKEIFLSDLDGKRFKDGDTVPSAVLLAKTYGASRNTIRKMLEELSAEGLLRRCDNNRFSVIADTAKKDTPELKKLSSKRLVIGWVYSGSRDLLIVRRTRGIERFCEEKNLDLRIVSSQTGHEPILKFFENIRNYEIDGIITANHCQAQYAEALNRLIQSDFPLVIACGYPQESCRVNVVSEDDFKGMYSATSYLLKNYNIPVYFLGDAENNNVRINAFRQAMCDMGFVHDARSNVRILKPEINMPENWDMYQKMLCPGKLIRPFLSTLKYPAGLVCSNDYIAFGVYEAAKELGLKIGRELMVIGFSDLPFAQRMNPPLTTVRVNYEKLGYQAAWLLYQHITGKLDCPIRMLLPAKIQKRASC